jgi:hypothetical protein
MRQITAAMCAVGLGVVLAACGAAPVAQSSAPPASPSTVSSTSATSSCSGNYPLPGLCGVGRAATAAEFAAMVAVGAPAVERDFGWKDWNACSNGDLCFKTGAITGSMIGTDAGSFTGGDGKYPDGGLGSACWVFLYRDAGGWHYVNAGCFQNPGYVPGVGVHVFVTGCANVRSAPGTSAAVVGCLANGTIADVDSAPVYKDAHIWWHLAGQGWMAHEFLVGPKPQ